jgi:hypothetical protein
MCIEPAVVEGRQRIVIKHFSLLKNEVGEEFDSPVRCLCQNSPQAIEPYHTSLSMYFLC